MSALLMQQAMENDGIHLDEPIIADSVFRHHIGRKKNTFYICHGHAGHYGDWALLPEGKNWSVKREVEFTAEERKAYAIKMQAARQARLEADEQRHRECRERSQIIWDNAPDAPDSFPYLVKKNVKAHGLKLHNGRLLVPVWDADNVLHGLQYIGEGGAKLFESGTAIKGHFSYISGDNSKPLYVCEGWATGATIHEATGATVIIAFSCGNLKPVAEAISQRVGGESCE